MGMERWGLPGTDVDKRRSEFFRGPLSVAKKALRTIGCGDFFEFKNNDVRSITKQTLTKGDDIETTTVKLRETPRLKAQREIVEMLAQNDPPTVRALEKVGRARKRPTSSGTSTPMTVSMREDDLERLRRGDDVVTRAITRLRDLQPVRRSLRLRGRRRNYRE